MGLARLARNGGGGENGAGPAFNPIMETRPRFWAKALATLTGNLFLVLGSALLGTISVLVSWIPPRGSWVFGVSRLWSRLLLTASWVRVEARYDPALDPGASYVFLANHHSMFDIPSLSQTHKTAQLIYLDAAFVPKQSKLWPA